MNTEDKLSHALQLATNNPDKRKDFYSCLLTSDIYLINQNPEVNEGQIDTSNGATLSLICVKNQKNEELFPIFSSPEYLLHFTKNAATYARINMQDFLNAIKCAPCILNPGSEYSKEFTTKELVALLDGSLFDGIREHVVAAGTRVFIGQPAVEPTQLIELLKNCFSQFENVFEGYIAQIIDEGDPVGPHLIVAVKGNGDLKELFHNASNRINSILPAGMIVDFIDLSRSEQFYKYFLEIEPFYRAWD